MKEKKFFFTTHNGKGYKEDCAELGNCGKN